MRPFVLLLLLSINAVASPFEEILPLKQRAEIVDSLTHKRVHQILPQAMKDADIDMWLLISSEYNEDPVLKTLLPATWLSARRTTMLVVTLTDENTVLTHAIAPYPVGKLFKRAWNKDAQPDQWRALAEFIEKHNPQRIGINQSANWAHADGLVASEKARLIAALKPQYQKRLVSAEAVAVAWLEQRLPEEIELMKTMGKIAHAIIAEGFSSKTITPGETTTEDLVWWFREKVVSLRLDTWFHPSVSIQRRSAAQFDHENTFTDASAKVIQHGDLLHVDFGISYLRLHTDTQQHAYVLRPHEKTAPDFLHEALAKGNQLQDIFTVRFAVGKTGNEVLKESLQAARKAGLKPTIYTHPLGYHGHAAGTTLGMWDQQDGVPGDGDYPLHANTAYSIELNNAYDAKEWNKEIRIMLEEDAYFDGQQVHYFDSRQTKLIEIRSQAN
ncbi:aminopeptidase P family protein [Alteromonas ponticola]|uniref:Aminopeptidase P family protein n=1 Tax=Alteromonas aquimaris TaxID=2998417 RepID=A0ABT3P8D6_9ALTE|nr:M24 family metallopeptidase [Alteromonas aquimaris]MCW8109023.1 aminopeptidase P family protein [Alteromonas aquimaris]